MADSRIKDATGTVISAELSALLNTLYLAVDDTSFTDFKKILLKTILTEAVVTANTNNYQAMTPKAFYDSIMTEVYNGIGKIATDANVTAKTGNDLLTAAKQAVMQTQWFKDWFINNGGSPHYEGDIQNNESAISFDVNYSTSGLISGIKVVIGKVPVRKYHTIYFNIAVLMGGTSFTKTDSIVYDSVAVEKFLGLSGAYSLYIGLEATGTNIYIKVTGPLTSPYINLSGHFNNVLY